MTLPTDTLYRFLFANAPVKGELVQLPHTWHTITHTAKKRAYPAVVTEILGQMTAACTLLSANLKFDGSMIMQIHGDGPIQLLVVECRSDLTIRATAKVAENANIDAPMDLQTLLNQNGNARFAITLDPNERQPGQQPYQGIVPLHGETIAEILMHYMSASEQLDTHIELAANSHSCAGILLQKLPLHGGVQNESQNLHVWDELCSIVKTVGADELLNTEADTLMHRLFWQYPLEHSTEQNVQFGCTCSPQKVTDMLKMLGEDEALDMLSEQNHVEVSCDFCGQTYELTAEQVRALFDPNVEPTSQLH
ncbi:MAG: Hsp33 family molecular chaperone HslO [Burkholderiaceae bacterium]|jgi:molecular chaperone Hsp33